MMNMLFGKLVEWTFKVAKWLLSVEPDINISMNDESVFSKACGMDI